VKILLLNAGSSTLKASVLESEGAAVVGRVTIDIDGTYTDAVRRATDAVGTDVAAVGHRIVHGGKLTAPVRVTPEVQDAIAALSELAPLHNPPGLEVLAAAQARLPSVPHVACFDTAFHATLPPVAYTYPLPAAWTGIRRYGFHGLSHAYCASRVPVERLIVCHLGHGCSAAAIRGGRSIDTTMGFTPLDGLMMATRSGSVDPGILTYVELHRGMTPRAVDDALNHRAGLVGVSGVSGDMREVLAAASAGDARARLAIDVYVYRVRQAIGALAVSLGGIDALVFTGGVGEHAPAIREAVCRDLEWLGLDLDRGANTRCQPDANIGPRIHVLVAREDLTMLAEVLRVVR
jgi:acetate kinase